jgi:hypothetical protein
MKLAVKLSKECSDWWVDLPIDFENFFISRQTEEKQNEKKADRLEDEEKIGSQKSVDPPKAKESAHSE